MSVPDLLVRSARSMDVNVALIRAFRRSPMDFLGVLVASGAGTTQCGGNRACATR